MDEAGSRQRLRFNPTAVTFVPSVGEDGAGASTPRTDDTSSGASSPSLEGEDPFDSNYNDVDDDELVQVPYRPRQHEDTHNLDGEGDHGALSLLPSLGPSRSPPRATSPAPVEVRAESSTRRSGRTLRDWLTPPTSVLRSPRAPGIAQHIRHINRNIWARDREERRTGIEAAAPRPTQHPLQWEILQYQDVNEMRPTQAPNMQRRPAPGPGLYGAASGGSGHGDWGNVGSGFRALPRADSPVEHYEIPSKKKRTHDDVEPSSPPPDDDDDDPYDPGADNEVTPPTRFHPFMRLPFEIREQVYAFAMCTASPILPHLCDSKFSTPTSSPPSRFTTDQHNARYANEIPKFHDINQKKQHNAIYLLLGITRASKQTRAEALPVFYAANTFSIGKDTSSYFDRLEYLGRFGMIRNVQFSIVHRLEKRASETLRGLSSYLAQKAVYEAYLREAAQNSGTNLVEYTGQGKGKAKADVKSTAALVGSNHRCLTQHPQYLVGGLADVNVLICLGKLCTASSQQQQQQHNSNNNNNTNTPHPNPSILTLPIPSSSIFTLYPTLSWFPLVATGLGITLQFVQGVPVDASGPGYMLLTWRQRWGKKAARAMTTTTALRAADRGANRGGGAGVAHTNDDDDDDTVTVTDDDTTGWLGFGALEVHQRALALNPGLEAERRSRLNAYYRVGCCGVVSWFDVLTEERGGAGV